jgi:cell division protein FtsX
MLNFSKHPTFVHLIEPENNSLIMDTIVIKSKGKSTSALLRKLLKSFEGVESITLLSKSDREDLAVIKAIDKGHTKKYVNTNTFLKKLEGK